MSSYNQWGIPLTPPIRRTVFISFGQSDRAEVDAFVNRWTRQERVCIPKAVGVAFGDDLINSDNADYVIGRIRRDYLADSTITLVLLGGCTHSRRFIDWELKASLRQGQNYTPNGLLGILLPWSTFQGYISPHALKRTGIAKTATAMHVITPTLRPHRDYATGSKMRSTHEQAVHGAFAIPLT